MSEAARVAGRDWLGELRATESDEAFSALVLKIAGAVPELREEVIEVSREFGGDELAQWAGGVFILPWAQPPVESPQAEPSIRRRFSAGAEPKPAEPEPPEDEPEPQALPAEEPGEPQEEPQRFDEAAEAIHPSKALVPVVGRTWVAEINFPDAMSGASCVEVLNQKHAVIGNYGGKTAVLSWERWGVNQRVLVPTFQKFEDFKKRYMNQYVQIIGLNSTKNVPAGEYWLKTPERGRAFDGVVYEPGKGEIVGGYRLNIWRDFAVRPCEGSWAKLRLDLPRFVER